jgi:hypothetical protein
MPSAAVVTKPNMESAMRALGLGALQAPPAMPHTAPAAWSRIMPLMEFKPRRSPTLWIMVMSLVPTTGAMSWAATVETMTLGAPRGRAFITLVARWVPEPPPAEITAQTSPLS